MAVNITRIASQDASASGTTSVTATYPLVPTKGNLLIAEVTQSDTSGTSSNGLTQSGWTSAISNATADATGTTMNILYKIAGANEGQLATATSSLGVISVFIYEYTGWSGTPTLDRTVSAENHTGVTSLASGSTATTTSADELVVVGISLNPAVTSPSFSNSFNTRGTGTQSFVGDKIVNVTGAQSSTASWTTSARAAICIASFKSVGPSFRLRPSIKPHQFSPGNAR